MRARGAMPDQFAHEAREKQTATDEIPMSFMAAGCQGEESICTVAVMPATRTTPSGTASM
jgi:hypothetical protein